MLRKNINAPLNKNGDGVVVELRHLFNHHRTRTLFVANFISYNCQGWDGVFAAKTIS
jgi:hypothetical protein